MQGKRIKCVYLVGCGGGWGEILDRVARIGLVREGFFFLPSFLFFFFVFLGLYPWHMEVPRLGVELEL